MNIADLVNPGPPQVPRRSPSNPHSVSAPSPAVSAAKLPTPPLTTHKSMPQKRKRRDPKPIWAYLENEDLPGELKAELAQREPRQHSRPAPPTPRPQPHPSPAAQSNGTPVAHQAVMGPPPAGPPPAFAPRELGGFERPLTNDVSIYDEVVRKVCDFIWKNVVENQVLQEAVREGPRCCQIEIEARWGQIIDRQLNTRLQGLHDSECILRSSVAESTKFESTMSLQQHQKMNRFLNEHTSKSQKLDANRIVHKHTKEIDAFYELDQHGFKTLAPAIQNIIHQSRSKQRIRVTRMQDSGQIVAKIIKQRVANLEISSPQTEWDYRIGVNLEIQYPGPVETLPPVVEHGQTPESMRRIKDRVSYSFNKAYQVDLTQVSQGPNKNHELELEVDAGMLLQAADNIKQGRPSDFESLVTGMMNNLRVLSREMTPQN
ncbi:mRNA triphosphatase CET1 [Lophiostoma macrostomum CBS 122681]|uniref:mRNA-capping enzyme subunit beta n=1 Tax=Lophiostoma macrostomum CBS 122681 TaxID=1314788 RepID=A0A6A6SYH8_9PLEO|nr:mRNA triphosphatase CET1 [Lophiostoma macrostomum CBS 122681]